MAASLRTFCIAVSRRSVRPFSSSCVTLAGKKWRLENGLAHSGSEYGPLTDLPDWSYADGRPAPLLKGQIRRQKQREEFARRAVYLSAEVDEGMKRWQEKKEEEKQKEEHVKSLLLKPKGNLLLKNKK
ncbi:39S ribosomal protein L52, mitochondrial isoform X2 [Onychostoma macrolepis]|uniref:39S ribosomal protein L52, mitochondrial isoform X2 n=1 Tax=Onychostoma macrolepis TaxID=369639 RepID=UPI002729A1DD|nr:39S ribosomal protein L52, mitochondrial isoform X2 [Onychostoma macrolepis]